MANFLSECQAKQVLGKELQKNSDSLGHLQWLKGKRCWSMKVFENKKVFSLIQHGAAACRCIKICAVPKASERFNIVVLCWHMSQVRMWRRPERIICLRWNSESELRNLIFKLCGQYLGKVRLVMTAVAWSNKKTADFCKCSVLPWAVSQRGVC